MDIYDKISELNAIITGLPDVKTLLSASDDNNILLRQPVDILSPAQVSYYLEDMDTVSAMLALPRALRFTHDMVINSGDCIGTSARKDQSIGDDVTWCASGISGLLNRLVFTPEYQSAADVSVECLSLMLRSWNRCPADCFQTIADNIWNDEIGRNILFPPAAIFLNVLLERKVPYKSKSLFHKLLEEWSIPDPECNVVSANWIIFCLCVRTAASDEKIFRNAHILQLVFNRESIQSHLKLAKECPCIGSSSTYNAIRRVLLDEQ